MRLGLALWPDRDVRALADLAVAAEDAGFDDLWWPDHYDSREVSSVLTMCASRTRRIRLGTAVTSPLLRHPAILASLFATVHEASDGRAVAGLGPGGFEVKTNLRVSSESPLTAIREAVAILRGLTGGGDVTVEGGKSFPVRDARLSFSAGSHVPVYLAGRGPRMMALAGEVADGLITHGLADAYLGLARDRVTAGAERGGRPADACEVALMLEVAVDDDLSHGRDALRPRCLYMVGGEYAEELIPVYGLDPERVIPIRRAVRAGDRAAASMIDDGMIDAFALTGPPERIGEGLARLAASGVRSCILSPGKGVDATAIAALGETTREVVG